MQKLLENLPKIQITPDFYKKEIPKTAGVYAYFKDKRVIYIGKANNLKARITSYFASNLETKTAKMIKEANLLSYIKVNSELEALLLEARLIRTYMPLYNVEAKDDKHPLYIRITKNKYPQILTARKIDQNAKNIAFYGPFPSSKNVFSVLRMLRRIFPYSDHKIGMRACIYSHIGLCNPCPNGIESCTDKEEAKKLQKIYLKNIKKLKSILDGHIDKVIKKLEAEMKFFSGAEKYEAAISVRNQIAQLEYITRPQLPADFYIANPNLYEDVRQKELSDLGYILKINKLERVECYDIAHLSGTNAAASMVTFVAGEPEKKLYRHFKIKSAKGGDDYGSMREVAKRRSRHFEDWGVPDLIVVDGSIGQVQAFESYIKNVKVVGIAKHPDRIIFGDKKIRLEGQAYNLIARMRDEAHRFARRYHHGLISKSIRQSSN